MTFLPHQLRVVDERQELGEKLEKLAEFLTTPTFVGLQKDEQHRLIRQHAAMDEYERILRQRIAAFNA